jgi:hypothetical protein
VRRACDGADAVPHQLAAGSDDEEIPRFAVIADSAWASSKLLVLYHILAWPQNTASRCRVHPECDQDDHERKHLEKRDRLFETAPIPQAEQSQ